MKKAAGLVILIAICAGLARAQGEFSIKGGAVLNKGDEKNYSWIFILENDYFIKGLISVGFETQFSSYSYMTEFEAEPSEVLGNPFNFFLNTKVKILKGGTVRPHFGAGIGYMSDIIAYPEKAGFEWHSAFHVLAGTNIYLGSKFALQVEFRFERSEKPDSKAKFILVGGIVF